MSELQFRYDWVDYEGDDHPWIKPTFARFSVEVEGRCVTRVLDQGARTTRDAISTPLYPLVEWLIANWWTLFDEAEVPSRGMPLDAYLDRHSLRRAREGYALPDLRIYPEGEWSKLEWKQQLGAHQRVEFLGSGVAQVRTAELQQSLTDLCNSVLDRLDAFGITDTWAHREWRVIQEMEPGEAEFCRACARLGCDPFDLDEASSAVILTVADRFPRLLGEELLQATTLPALESAAAWLETGLQAIQSHAPGNHRWDSLRQGTGAATNRDFPWNVGYERARRLRHSLGMESAEPEKLDLFLHEVSPIVKAERPPVASFDALMGSTTPVCYTAKERPDAQRFVRARGLADYFFDRSPIPVLLSSAETGRQQRGRAFAAEFLAPAAQLKIRLSGDEIGIEEVEELAAEFRVSSMVIGHQITNHGLARIST